MLKATLRRLTGRRAKPRRYEMGAHSYGEPRVRTWGGKEKAYIGKYCSIATGVTIITSGNHHTGWVSTYPFNAAWEEWSQLPGQSASKGDVHIGNDVWLAYDCTILSGVTVGDGAAVAACAVVTKDVPPYAIVAGNPARVVRYRFDEATRARLLEVRWWDWPEEEVRQAVPLLMSDDIKAFLRAAEARVRGQRP